MNGQTIREHYERLISLGTGNGAPEHCLTLFSNLRAAGTQEYENLLDRFPCDYTGTRVLDIGCKWGQLAPFFFSRGASEYVGIDVVPQYIEGAQLTVGAAYNDARFLLSSGYLLDLPPSSFDVVFMNEVISHVNPMFLEGTYSEVARVLRPGGHLLLSDGNNIETASCRAALIDLYDAWENGPVGRKTDRDVVSEPFRERRRAIVASRHPELPAKTLDYLAKNTFGLFGSTFLDTVDRYVTEGTLVERPYRLGLVPTNPADGGTVMERGFYPSQVLLALAGYGIDARRVTWREDLGKGAQRLVRHAFRGARHYTRRALKTRGFILESWGFQIFGVKR